MIDLRSDTVTRPTPAMREAMARAEQVMHRAKEVGVLIGPVMPTRLRAVFHLGVTGEQGLSAAKTLAKVVRALCSSR